MSISSKVLSGATSILQSVLAEDEAKRHHVAKAWANLSAACTNSFLEIALMAETLLAELEHIGNHKKKPERIQKHIEQVDTLNHSNEMNCLFIKYVYIQHCPCLHELSEKNVLQYSNWKAYVLWYIFMP